MSDNDNEWLEWRRQGIGASDVPVICGLSPWGSRWQVWAEKTGRIPPQDATEKMRAGKRAERYIAESLTEERGLYVAGEQTWCEHPELRWPRATVDGWALESPNGAIADALGLVELKNSGDRPFAEGAPTYWQAQCQWQMFVTGAQHTFLVVMHRGWELAVYDVPRDEQAIELLLERCSAFWELVLDDTPPDTDGNEATAKALATVYKDVVPKTERPVPPLLEHELFAAKVALAAAEERYEAATNAVKAHLGEADTAVSADNGWTLATWRPVTSTRIDVDRLRRELPEIADLYAEATTTRRFLPNQRALKAYKEST